MLKVACHPEEKRGNQLMRRWNTRGAARVLEYDDTAIVLEHADSDDLLTDMSLSGGDDEATDIICGVVARLHEAPLKSPPKLVPLERWFEDLWPAAEKHGGSLKDARQIAESLLADQREIVALHGDIHHGNVLHFGDRGWLAIDPKGLLGDRCFDYANLFCNPNAEFAASEARFLRRLEIVSDRAAIKPGRLLGWIAAYAALSATWFRDAGKADDGRLELAQMVIRKLQS